MSTLTPTSAKNDPWKPISDKIVSDLDDKNDCVLGAPSFVATLGETMEL